MVSKRLIIGTTELAHWYELINEAQSNCAVNLSEVLQSYLVFLLMRFTDNADISESILAMDFLDSLNAVGKARQDQLQELGDKCLLFSGLFPGRAEKRRVCISYFVNLGKNAYATLSHDQQDFVEHVEGFVAMMDVLQATRPSEQYHENVSLLQLQQLWQETASQTAWQQLEAQLDGFIVDNTDNRLN